MATKPNPWAQNTDALAEIQERVWSLDRKIDRARADAKEQRGKAAEIVEYADALTSLRAGFQTILDGSK